MVEAAAFIHATPALVRYRVAGLCAASDGSVRAANRVLGKASRPAVAAMFLAPPPPGIVAALADAGRISPAQARLAARVPLADDVCAEADSGGHTDKRVASTLMAAFLRLRDEARAAHGYAQHVRIGAAGGLGTPEAIAAAFVLGADFVVTGSINQCTVEAGTSDAVKDLLAAANVQDMEMTPAGDMFEIGAKVQVLRKGVLFPARANALYELYRQHRSIDDIDPATRRRIEAQYFHRTLDEVWEETRTHYGRVAPDEIAKAEANPKAKMALIFRWYFVHTNRLAIEGRPEARVDFQIHCGPAMGAFNQFVKGTPYEPWRRRHVDEIAELLMQGAAGVLQRHFERLQALNPSTMLGAGGGTGRG
jgi:trans-AT polyketide synthase/acyltransferase/oxidoreductase domain-containing protein